MTALFANRAEAGCELAQVIRQRMREEDLDDMLVLALPRGGVPVAYELARALGLELDVLLVRKLGVPGSEELAMGAIALGGMDVVRVLNRNVVDALEIPDHVIDQVAARELEVLHTRARQYRGNIPPPRVTGRPVLVVDDGLATGTTMRSAVLTLRQMNPSRIVVAVPVAPPSTVHALAAEADEVLCVTMPEPFWSVGAWYEDFRQVDDDHVRALLAAAREQDDLRAEPDTDDHERAPGAAETMDARLAPE